MSVPFRPNDDLRAAYLARIREIRDRFTLSDFIAPHVRMKRCRRGEFVGKGPFHQEKTPSFTINNSKGFYPCFGCGAHGDVIDFIQQAFRMPSRAVISHLSLERGLGPQIRPALKQTSAGTHRQEEGGTPRYESARRTWDEAQPPLNTPVEWYLRSRGIEGPIPASLRYHPELRYQVSDRIWKLLPGMVAEFRDRYGRMTAIHRTFLTRDGSGKATVDRPKMALGNAAAGAIYLAAPSDMMNITEGIETGLSLMALNGLPIAAAASTGFMTSLQLPPLPLPAEITIGSDNDPPGQKAARLAATRWRAEGRKVRIIKPRDLKDYNDVLRRWAERDSR